MANDDGKIVSFDDLVGGSPTFEGRGGFINEDGESTFDLRSATPQQLIEIKKLIDLPCGKISKEEIDQIDNVVDQEWSDLFNGRIPSTWHQNSNREIYYFLHNIRNLPIEFTKKYIPADWITAILLTDRQILDYIPDLIVNCTLRPIDVLLINRHLKNARTTNLRYTRLDEIFSNTGLEKLHSAFNQSTKLLLDKIYPLSPNLFWNFQENLSKLQSSELLKWFRFNESRPELKEFNYDLRTLKIRELLSEIALHINPSVQNSNKLDLEIIATASEPLEDFDETFINKLIIYPNYQWYSLSNLAILQKMTIPQNVVIFNRILEEANAGQEISLAILSQLRLGVSHQEIEKSLMLARYYNSFISGQAHNKKDKYQHILENVSTDGKIRSIIGETSRFLREFFKK